MHNEQSPRDNNNTLRARAAAFLGRLTQKDGFTQAPPPAEQTPLYPPSREGLEHMNTYTDNRNDAMRKIHDNHDRITLNEESLSGDQLRDALENANDRLSARPPAAEQPRQ